ncbi:hypothetical protein IQ64_37055 [Streptomyces stelliscabiei]|nr:hypothetical protein IQ64_37055 [Streptomyces stelliscabiei]
MAARRHVAFQAAEDVIGLGDDGVIVPEVERVTHMVAIGGAEHGPDMEFEDWCTHVDRNLHQDVLEPDLRNEVRRLRLSFSCAERRGMSALMSWRFLITASSVSAEGRGGGDAYEASVRMWARRQFPGPFVQVRDAAG